MSSSTPTFQNVNVSNNATLSGTIKVGNNATFNNNVSSNTFSMDGGNLIINQNLVVGQSGTPVNTPSTIGVATVVQNSIQLPPYTRINMNGNRVIGVGNSQNPTAGVNMQTLQNYIQGSNVPLAAVGVVKLQPSQTNLDVSSNFSFINNNSPANMMLAFSGPSGWYIDMTSTTNISQLMYPNAFYYIINGCINPLTINLTPVTVDHQDIYGLPSNQVITLVINNPGSIKMVFDGAKLRLVSLYNVDFYNNHYD